MRCNSHVIGILEYFVTHVHPPEPTLIQVLNAIGQQISQFLERRRAQSALHTTETKHRLIFENANDALAVSVEERFIYVNQAYATMFGYSHPDKLVGDVSIYDTLPTEKYELVREHRRQSSRIAGTDAIRGMGETAGCDEILNRGARDGLLDRRQDVHPRDSARYHAGP